MINPIVNILGNYFQKVKNVSPAKLLKNLAYLGRYDYKSELRDTQAELKALTYYLGDTRLELLYLKILDFYHNNPSDQYENELSFLRKTNSLSLFPYQKIANLGHVDCQFDSTKKLPYVFHRNNKRLYFPADWSLNKVREMYISLVEEQGLLGGNYYEKNPHQYQTKEFLASPNDIILDIGAAEGIFALDNIDIAHKVYLFESDETWINALRATFDPYQSKVHLINKFVSDIDSLGETTLKSSLVTERQSRFFIKMDIEGDEVKVLKGNKDFFVNTPDVRIACCTYHRNNDANDIKNMLDAYGYETEFSDGYMIFVHDKNIQPPYFRHGLIRGHRPASNSGNVAV